MNRAARARRAGAWPGSATAPPLPGTFWVFVPRHGSDEAIDGGSMVDQWMVRVDLNGGSMIDVTAVIRVVVDHH